MADATTPAAAPPAETAWQKYAHVVYKLLFAVAGIVGGYAASQPSGSGCKCPTPPAAVTPAPAPAPAKAEPPKADEPPKPTRRRYGWRPSHSDPDERVFEVAEPPTTIPASADLSGPPLEPAYDQGDLGACGPNALSKLIRFCQAKSGVANPSDPSRLYAYYNARALMGTTRQDSGVSNKVMLKAVAQYGWCDEAKWPYNVRRFTARPTATCYTQGRSRLVSDYGQVPQTLTAMKTCLASGHPFIFGFTVYESFESSQVAHTGDVPMPGQAEAVLGGHDVLIVGFDDATQKFKFLNSWGPGWGNRGYGTIPYAYATNPGLASDFWTIRTATTVPRIVPLGEDVGLRGLTFDIALAF